MEKPPQLHFVGMATSLKRPRRPKKTRHKRMPQTDHASLAVALLKNLKRRRLKALCFFGRSSARCFFEHLAKRSPGAYSQALR